MTRPDDLAADARKRLKLTLLGAVQGVGFRPFVYRLACELGLTGWVSNSPQGVFVEAEGCPATLQTFRSRLTRERPARSYLQSSEAAWLDPVGYDGFVIRDSDTSGSRRVLVLPDIATCPDCLRDILDPANRRYRYPFTNCTHCGPRFSIIESLPYDRANTSMRRFHMCPACRAEYEDPADRRFHAQPNACPVCGPQMELWPGKAVTHADGPPRNLAHGNDALLAAAHILRCGQVLAVKGIGGFHLMVDARNERAVQRLRERKHREEKPFALLFPTLASVKDVCEVSPLEERLLQSPEAPIVLLKKRCDEALENWSAESRPAPDSAVPSLHHSIAASVAPNNPDLGVMLPSNPLHHLLLAELGFPVVATSGNLSDEPICTDEREVIDRLGGIADAFLVHNRPIVRHVDDSIVRVMLDREMVLRRARGYAPLPVQTQSTDIGARNILAVGAHLKNSVALAVGEQVFLSQHIGDLETERANAAFQNVIRDFQKLYEATPDAIAADLHPDYLSTQFAVAQASLPAGLDGIPGSRGWTEPGRPAGSQPGSPRHVGVQHHIAHVLSCMAENELPPPVLGVAWDGTGLGTDGTIWGGEFFRVTAERIERVAHWRAFPLPGGDAAAREPRRAALGLLSACPPAHDVPLHDLHGSIYRLFAPAELATLQTMLARKLNAPMTSSVGRLFDAVAAILGLRGVARFEGQAAMDLEFAIGNHATDSHYPVELLTHDSMLILDWEPMVAAVALDLHLGVPVAEIAARFHNTLVESILIVARRLNLPRVALSGGCFQNRCLTERTIRRLRAEGFQPSWHQRVPPNDGGIALGQVVAAQRELAARNSLAAPAAAAQAAPLSRNTEHALR